MQPSTSPLAALLFASAVAFATDPAARPSSAAIERKLGSEVPMQLEVVDETGVRRPLATLRSPRQPAILVLSWYRCPNLCGLVLDGLISAMNRMRMRAGQDYQLLTLSIDPDETPAMARMRKRVVLTKLHEDLRSHLSPDGWRFLTAPGGTIQKISRSVGFHYAYDEGSRQFAHPAGLIVLDAENHVSAYLGGISFSPQDLEKAMHAATSPTAVQPPNNLVQAFLSCFHYDPSTGRYSRRVLTAFRVTGASFAILLAVSLHFLRLRKVDG